MNDLIDNIRGMSEHNDVFQLAFPPAARNIDPNTSHEAAAQIIGRKSKVQRIAEYVAMFPGLTTGQICAALSLEGGWKRISDAKNQGLIVYGAPREYQGRNQRTCWPSSATIVNQQQSVSPEITKPEADDELWHHCNRCGHDWQGTTEYPR